MNDSNDLAALRAAAASGAPDDLYRLATALVADLQMEEAFETHRRAVGRYRSIRPPGLVGVSVVRRVALVSLMSTARSAVIVFSTRNVL